MSIGNETPPLSGPWAINWQPVPLEQTPDGPLPEVPAGYAQQPDQYEPARPWQPLPYPPAQSKISPVAAIARGFVGGFKGLIHGAIAHPFMTAGAVLGPVVLAAAVPAVAPLVATAGTVLMIGGGALGAYKAVSGTVAGMHDMQAGDQAAAETDFEKVGEGGFDVATSLGAGALFKRIPAPGAEDANVGYDHGTIEVRSPKVEPVEKPVAPRIKKPAVTHHEAPVKKAPVAKRPAKPVEPTKPAEPAKPAPKAPKRPAHASTHKAKPHEAPAKPTPAKKPTPKPAPETKPTPRPIKKVTRKPATHAAVVGGTLTRENALRLLHHPQTLAAALKKVPGFDPAKGLQLGEIDLRSYTLKGVSSAGHPIIDIGVDPALAPNLVYHDTEAIATNNLDELATLLTRSPLTPDAQKLVDALKSNYSSY